MKHAKRPGGLLLTVGLAIAPVVLALVYAAAYSIGLAGILSHGFTMRHWQAVVLDSAFWYSLAYSLYIAVCAILLAGGAALLLMLQFKDRWLRGRLRLLNSLPLVFPSLLVAFLIIQWCGKAGLLSRMLFNAGIIHDLHAFPDLINDSLGIGIIIAQVLMATPFFVLLFANIYHDSRMDEYAALSASLGAGKRQFYRAVLLPVLLRRAAPSLVLYGIFVMGAYETPLLLGRSYPQMLSMFTVQKLSRFDIYDKPQAYAIAILIFGITMMLLSVMFHFQKRAHAEDQ